jgi:hypothetical protein
VQIERAIASIREDRRSDYLWNTDVAADALGIHPNRFHDWWYRTREKLVALCAADPGSTAAEMLAIIALAESQRTKQSK